MLRKLPVEKIEFFIQLEPFFTIAVAILLGWIFYTLFLRRISVRRHVTLKRRFVKTILYLCLSALMAAFHWGMLKAGIEDTHTIKFVNFMALISFLVLVTVTIRLAQIYVYLYLFFSNIRTGVPRLIANLFTLLFSTVVISWLSAEVFDVHLATVLTTSAIFTIVLGIALQDTLGNLFSGVALQIERPFQLDDWVEIQSGGETWVGQIYEITWRATSMIGFTDQLIIIPNKTIAQSQLTIFTHHHKSPRLFQQFRIRFETPIDEAKLALLEGVRAVDEVLHDPPPRVFVSDVTEAWVMMRVYYSLRDYGRKIEAADQVISNALESLHKRGIYTGTNLTRVGTWFEESVPHVVMDEALALIKESQRDGIYGRKPSDKPL